MELKKIRRRGLGRKNGVVARINAKVGQLYIGSEIARQLNDWKYVELYYGVDGERKVLVLKKVNELNDDAYTLHRYVKTKSIVITSKNLTRELKINDNIVAKDYEIKTNELWLYF